MVIFKSKKYNKSYKKLILDKHLEREMRKIREIEVLFKNANNLQELMRSPYKNFYRIEQKNNNLREFFTARINDKMRLIMKPLDKYPYNYIEIEEIEFIDIDNKHYGEG